MKKNQLLGSIAEAISDYREGEIPRPTPEHVNRWISQFEPDVQIPMLAEINHVLNKTYFSKENVKEFLGYLIKNPKFVGKDFESFWKDVEFLNIQGGGNSQREMLGMFDAILINESGLSIANCGKRAGSYLYLDDVVFTGNRIRIDLGTWIKNSAPEIADVNVVVLALHRGGQYFANKKIQESAKASGKKITVRWWRSIEIEDRKNHIDSSDVLRPTCIPVDMEVETYVSSLKYAQIMRKPGSIGVNKFFSCEEGRSLLEQEFLKAGAKIRSLCPNLNKYQRPLGNMILETLGFGSLLVTFRNCPNNCPLAFWAGNPWYPLFPRSTNSETFIKKVFASIIIKNKVKA